MKRVAVAVFLLALLCPGCGETKPDGPLVPPWPPELSANYPDQARVEGDALIAEATDRGIVVTRDWANEFWWGDEEVRLRSARHTEATLEEAFRDNVLTREELLYEAWRFNVLEAIRMQEGMADVGMTAASDQRERLARRIVKARSKHGK